MPKQGLIIFGPDGEPARRATPAEQAAFDAAEKERKDFELYRMVCEMHDAKADQKMYKALKAKGLQHSKTRSMFAWRLRHRAHSAVKFESYSTREDKYGNPIPASAPWNDFDYAPPGEGTLWRLVPRLRITDLEVFDVWVIRQAKGRKRRRCVEKGFKRNCGDVSCGSMECAVCWAVENVETKDNETIKVMRRDGNPKVTDSAGVHPKGARNAHAQDLGDDQRGPFQLTSTIHARKEGASSQGVGTELPRDPADAKKFHR